MFIATTPSRGLITMALALAALCSAPPSRVAAGDADVERILEILEAIPGPEEVLRIARERALEREASAEPAAAAGEIVPIFRLRDGSIVRGALAGEALELETPYGLLAVPVAEMVEVRFALRVASETAARIEAAVPRLGDDDFAIREEATAELAAIGIDAVPALRRAADSEDEEVRRRAEKLLEEIEPLADDESGSIPLLDGRDRVTTRGFALEGRVTAGEFTVVTPYGDLRIPRLEVAQIRFRKEGPTTVTVTVPATAAIPGGWIRTEVDVRRGDRVEITASGQMSIPDYGYVAGPGGGGRVSRGYPGLSELALVGRVGEKGGPFLVGEKYSGKAPASGTLYLGIVPFRYTYYSTVGAYEVKIEAR